MNDEKNEPNAQQHDPNSTRKGKGPAAAVRGGRSKKPHREANHHKHNSSSSSSSNHRVQQQHNSNNDGKQSQHRSKKPYYKKKQYNKKEKNCNNENGNRKESSDTPTEVPVVVVGEEAKGKSTGETGAGKVRKNHQQNKRRGARGNGKSRTDGATVGEGGESSSANAKTEKPKRKKKPKKSDKKGTTREKPHLNLHENENGNKENGTVSKKAVVGANTDAALKNIDTAVHSPTVVSLNEATPSGEHPNGTNRNGSRENYSNASGTVVEEFKDENGSAMINKDKSQLHSKEKQKEEKKHFIDMNAMAEDKKSKTKSKKAKKSKKKKEKSKKSTAPDPAVARRKFSKLLLKTLQSRDLAELESLLTKHEHHDPPLLLEAHAVEAISRALMTAALFNLASLLLSHSFCAKDTLEPHQAEAILLCLPQNLRGGSPYHVLTYLTNLAIRTKFSNEHARQYWLRIARGICLEFTEEALSVRDRLCSVAPRYLSGQSCVCPAVLTATQKQNVYVAKLHDNGMLINEFVNTERGWVAGDAVGLLPFVGDVGASAEALDSYLLEGTLLSSTPRQLTIRLHSPLPENFDWEHWRVDKLANRMGFARLLRALTTFLNNEQCSTDIKDIMTAHAVEEGASVAAKCVEEVQKVDGLEAELERLNPSQRAAVLGAVSQRMTLIQGPPGTGKTAVGIRILNTLAQRSRSPILACSDSNVAVDNLVSGCASLGLNVVRLGRPESVRQDLLQYCLLESNSNNTSTNSTNVNTHNSFGNANNNRNGVSSWSARLERLKSAQIICCTCIGAGTELLDVICSSPATKISQILIDEATQCTEPAILVPLSRLCGVPSWKQQVILVGDHCQLPPTVLSRVASSLGLGVSLFTRLTNQFSEVERAQFMLDTQYRMHPAIAMFPSDLFYGGKLINGVHGGQRRPLAGFPWPRPEFPVAFVPIYSNDESEKNSSSKFNKAEAEAASYAVEALLSGGQCRPCDIAVVTPYSAQVRLLRKMIVRKYGKEVEVSSTDGFQGREKEAVIFSAVRSNDTNQIGFTSDWRRVNVSFTRARRALIVIGNDATLRRGDPETWLPWLAWADAHGINMDRPGTLRGRYDPEHMRKLRKENMKVDRDGDIDEHIGGEREIARMMMSDGGVEDALRALALVEDKDRIAVKEKDGNDNNDNDSDNRGSENNCNDLGMERNMSALDLRKEMDELANADGHWDDSSSDEEDEDGKLSTTISRNTSVTNFSGTSATKDIDEEVPDIWDM